MTGFYFLFNCELKLNSVNQHNPEQVQNHSN